MQAVRISIIVGLLIGMTGCGSSSGAASKDRKDSRPKFEIWYVLEVGGRPETGRSHYYRLAVKEGDICRPENILFQDTVLSFRTSAEEGIWEAYRHFGPGEDVPGGLLSAEISFNCDQKEYQEKRDSIYLKESIILP